MRVNRKSTGRMPQALALACMVASSTVFPALGTPCAALADDQTQSSTQGENTPSFSDVDAKTPHQEDVMWMAEKGITTGFEDGTFRPYAGTARCDIAAFMFRLAKLWNYVDDDWTPTYEQKHTFTDVDENTPHAKEIWWLASESITTGWTEPDNTRTFRPYVMVARQDMAAFLFRLSVASGKGGAVIGWLPVDKTKERFRDVTETPDRHARDIWWLFESGISDGWKVGTDTYEFRGLEPIARCDLAAFLSRMNEM